MTHSVHGAGQRMGVRRTASGPSEDPSLHQARVMLSQDPNDAQIAGCWLTASKG